MVGSPDFSISEGNDASNLKLPTDNTHILCTNVIVTSPILTLASRAGLLPRKEIKYDLDLTFLDQLLDKNESLGQIVKRNFSEFQQIECISNDIL